MDVSQAELATLESVGQAFVVDAKKMENGGLEVMDMDRVFHGVETKLIGSAITGTRFGPPSSQPGGKGVGVMIPAPSWTVFDVSLNERSPAKFTAPDNQCVVE